MKNAIKKYAVLFLTAATLFTAACGGEPQSTENENTTVAETDAVTEEQADRSVPQTGAFTHTTALEFGEQSVELTEKEISEEYKFESAKKSGAVFGIGEGKVKGSVISLNTNTVASVNIGVKFNENSISKYSFRLKASDPEADYDAAYFGLRLESTGAAPNHESARVWILMKDQKIGIRTGKWPQCKTVASPVDFSAGVTVYFEDDPVSNIITGFYDDNGEKKPLCKLVITDTALEFYLEGSEKPDITDKLSVQVPKTGYSRIWTHHMKNETEISELKISGSATVKTTVPTDMLNSRDVFSDTWVAIDDAGRTTPDGAETPAATDKKVGMFYFMWHDAKSQGQNPLFDHTAAYLEGGADAVWDLIPKGNIGFAHYWAEPYFGYYNSDDEWVIRKHGYMLSEMGVDFIFVDSTNGVIYEKSLEALLRVWSKMRAEGQNTPQICFHCGNDDTNAASSLNYLWNNYYSIGKYSDLWFYWDGKPLIFFPDTMTKKISDEMKNFFTARQSWANTEDDWYKNKKGKGRWAWADMYPQKPGLSPSGKIEQMIVMCGFWANGSYGTNAGRSYTYKNGIPWYDGDWDFGYALMNTTSGLGLAYQEQFDLAKETDPPILMITGWNEWWAGRWGGSSNNPAQGQTICNEYVVDQKNPKYQWYYVDNFNTEYSRDIEPMKGGFNDNYFYQTVQNVRMYKGSRAVDAAFGQWDIDIKGDPGQWNIVGPEYRDYKGDTASRDWFSYAGNFRYTNDTGRNDIVTCKVSSDADNLYFYCECADEITPPEGENWMNLFIDSDCSAETGWYGFDYVINRSRTGGKVSVEKFTDGKWKFEKVGDAEFDLRDNVIQIKIPRSLIPTGETFDFKWADNSVDDGDIMKFLDKGDAAPSGRFKYRYTTAKTAVKIPECLTSDMTVLKAGSYYAFVNGKQVRLDDSSTKAVMLGRDEKFYIPKSFAESALGLDCSGLETYDHYGIVYVMPAGALAECGKTVSFSGDGLVVISSSNVDMDTMTALYRALT